jgi:hypothetical protein
VPRRVINAATPVVGSHPGSDFQSCSGILGQESQEEDLEFGVERAEFERTMYLMGVFRTSI